MNPTVNGARTAETALVSQLHATADALAGIATSNVNAALERVRAEAVALKGRIEAARNAVAAELLDVLACFEGLTTELVEGMEQPALPAPVEAPAQPTIPAPIAAAPAPVVQAAPAPLCPGCGFAPRKGENWCRACNLSVEPIPPSVVAQGLDASGPGSNPRPELGEVVRAEALGTPACGEVPAEAPKKPRRRGKAAANLNGAA